MHVAIGRPKRAGRVPRFLRLARLEAGNVLLLRGRWQGSARASPPSHGFHGCHGCTLHPRHPRNPRFFWSFLATTKQGFRGFRGTRLDRVLPAIPEIPVSQAAAAHRSTEHTEGTEERGSVGSVLSVDKSGCPEIPAPSARSRPSLRSAKPLEGFRSALLAQAHRAQTAFRPPVPVPSRRTMPANPKHLLMALLLAAVAFLPSEALAAPCDNGPNAGNCLLPQVGPIGPTSLSGDATCIAATPASCGHEGLGATSVMGNATCTAGSNPNSCGNLGLGATSVMGNATCTSTADDSCGSLGLGATSVMGSATCASTAPSDSSQI